MREIRDIFDKVHVHVRDMKHIVHIDVTEQKQGARRLGCASATFFVCKVGSKFIQYCYVQRDPTQTYMLMSPSRSKVQEG